MIDLIILLAIGIGLFVGYSRGVIRQLGSLCSLLVAVVACRLLGDVATEMAASWMGLDLSEGPGHAQAYVSASIVGNAVLFIVVWWGLSLVARLLHNIVRAIHLGVINSLLGALFMAFKVLLVASLVVNLWMVRSSDSDMISSGGPVMDFVAEVGPALIGVVAANF